MQMLQSWQADLQLEELSSRAVRDWLCGIVCLFCPC
jgi:hypothetical protein